MCDTLVAVGNATADGTVILAKNSDREPNEVLMKDPSLLTPQARDFAGYPGGHTEGFPDTFKQLYHAVYRYIRAGDFTAPPDFPTFADGHEGILLCDAIERSAREKQWIEIER